MLQIAWQGPQVSQTVPKRHTCRKIWIYKRANFEEANTTLQSIPSYCLPASDVDSLWSQWLHDYHGQFHTLQNHQTKPKPALHYRQPEA